MRNSEECPVCQIYINAKCIIYMGDNLPLLGVSEGDTLEEMYESLEAYLTGNTTSTTSTTSSTSTITSSTTITTTTYIPFIPTYFVSNTGDDSNDGLTEETPWQTLERVNAATFVPGDGIGFKRGDVFYGSITISHSGTLYNSITFGAYGTGVNPIITGFTTVTAWTNLGNNVWESTNAVSTLSTCNMVSINGENTPMGRYPNLGSLPGNDDYLRYQSWTTTSITSSSLTGDIDWTGAECVTRTHLTRIDRNLIISQSGSTLNFAVAQPSFTNECGFFIQNDPRTLDTQNEWYYNPITKKIQVYSTSQPTDIKVTSIENIITIDREDYITIRDLSILGANKNGIYKYNSGDSQRQGYVVQNCELKFFGNRAIYLVYINNVLIENNLSYYCNGDALVFQGNDNIIVKGNDIRHNGIIKGAELDGGAYSAIMILSECSNVIIENNQIVDTGNNGITFDGDFITIRNNYIDTFNQIMTDGGGITGGNRNNETIDTENIITRNLILNGIGNSGGSISPDYSPGKASEGIYTADDITYLTISNNYIANCIDNGIYATFCDHVYITGNTIFNCGSQLLFKVQSQLSNNRIVSENIFIAKTSDQYAARYALSVDVSLSFSQMNNNIYGRPILDTEVIAAAGNRTLASWRTYSGFDTNSIESPYIIASESELYMVYNENNFVANISIPFSSKDLLGNIYTDFVTLQPYTSIILFQII